MPGVTFKAGRWIDNDSGLPLPPDQQKARDAEWRAAETTRAVKQVRTLPEMQQAFRPRTLIQAAARNLPPIAAQIGGEAGGASGMAALAVALGQPELIPLFEVLGGAGGAGAAGIGAKHLPQRLGGSPEESNLRAFTWPALGSAVGRLAPRALKGYSARKILKRVEKVRQAFDERVEAMAKELHARFGERLKPTVLPSAVQRIAGVTGRQPYHPEPTGEIGQQEAFQARDAVLGPINRRRRELGEPLGDAYRALKGGSRISEDEAGDIAEAAQSIRDELIAPYPKAQPIFARIKQWRRRDMIAAEVPTEAKLQRTDGDYIVKGKLTASDVDWMKLNNFTDEQIKRLLEASQKYQPPTLDELRELRQVNNALLRNAEGGDIHALLDLQQAIDEHLMPHLPPEHRARQASYFNFLNNYKWREIRDLRSKGPASAMVDWMFQKKSPQAIEMIRHATPAERAVYQRMYASRLFGGINDRDLPVKQMAELRSNASEDMQSGLVRELYGQQADATIDALTQFPLRAAHSAEIWKSPAVQRGWTENLMRVASQAGSIDRQAAERAYADLVQSMPAEERQQFMQGLPPQTQMPAPSQPLQLEGPGVILQKDIAAQANAPYKWPTQSLSWAIPWGFGSLMLGQTFGVAYMAGRTAIAAGSATTKAGYRWIINRGGAELMSKAYRALAAGDLHGSAAFTFRALVQIGARMGHEYQRNKTIEEAQ